MYVWPRERYIGDRYFKEEQEMIFQRSWMCVAHQSELPKPGSFKTVQIGTENVLLTRNKAGEVRAMMNLCQHRGARVCAAEEGSVKARLRCMYHGWSYDLDGRLTGVPFAKQFPEDQQSSQRQGLRERRLPPVAVEEWLGYIWINVAADAPPLMSQVGPMLESRFGDTNPLGQYQTDELTVAKKILYEVEANWKLLWENFSECYHCPTMHQDLCGAVPQFAKGYGTVTGPKGLGAELALDSTGFSMSGRPTAEQLPGVPDRDSHSFYGILLWPSVQVVFVPDHVFFMRMEPVSATHTRVIGEWLFHSEAVAEPDFDPTDAVKIFDITNREDFEACERMQLGAHSHHYDDSQIYSPFEYRIEAFRRWVDHALVAPKMMDTFTQLMAMEDSWRQLDAA